MVRGRRRAGVIHVHREESESAMGGKNRSRKSACSAEPLAVSHTGISAPESGGNKTERKKKTFQRGRNVDKSMWKRRVVKSRNRKSN